MSRFDLFSIGHSNIPAERFICLLRSADVKTVADVRSAPFSRRFPWFNGKRLAERLVPEGMTYAGYGEMLGGRPGHPGLYCDGVADYEAMARQPDFVRGIDQAVAAAGRCGVCLMCAEREPLDCHRCLLVARALAERGLAVGHILHDGAIEPHRATEERLIALCGEGADLFVTGQRERLAAAYRRRARAVAYRAKAVPTGAKSVAESL